ncbi:alpha/beta fold family hydrolase [Streptococcus pneumoniae]|uniref:alpha/beta hydrolase n=1 Tax=Streptococcus pneumoniae TaxID=1313 RepID=UPI000777ABB4|nr:alpha/beta hydrolase [Streptococcus pneumoniae]KXW16909.1 alpha/beta hydrolase [Streptococcus pneumoniae]MDS3264639.1 alpha/beta hydrolase [Streptococcus pneumoniae]MDS6130638.1 alpha/beta hydrolase [Streptococcus pneumoniae]NMH06185.1 alpha/beta fold hydrolase [Streptococcus pneumoniae]ODO34663.1 alpha/beta hydrolase [Streptococcus pneumoniae]
MKRFEVSTEIGSLSVTYQKQKKVLVCLNGAGLLPSYENFSLILEKPPPTIGYLTIDFPNTGRSPIHDQAGKNLDNLADAVYEVLEELGISEYILCAHSWSGILACKLLEKPIKRQTLIAIEPTTKKVMFADFSENPYPEMEEQMRLIDECGPELYFKNLTQATFSPETNKKIWELMQEKGLELENQDPEFQIPVFIFCQTYREKEYRESEYWTSNTKLILGRNHHYLQWSESEKIAAIIRELSE